MSRKKITAKASYADGYEAAMQFRGASATWLLYEIERLSGHTAKMLEQYAVEERPDNLQYGPYMAGQIEGFSVLLKEQVLP